MLSACFPNVHRDSRFARPERLSRRRGPGHGSFRHHRSSRCGVRPGDRDVRELGKRSRIWNGHFGCASSNWWPRHPSSTPAIPPELARPRLRRAAGVGLGRSLSRRRERNVRRLRHADLLDAARLTGGYPSELVLLLLPAALAFSILLCSRAPEPPREDRAAIARGKQLFLEHCAICHGPGGDGRGARSAWLDPRPPDFTNSQWQVVHPAERVTSSIRDGRRGTAMPAWAHAQSPGVSRSDRVREIAVVVRPLTKAAALTRHFTPKRGSWKWTALTVVTPIVSDGSV